MVRVLDVRAEHRRNTLGIGEPQPRLSWITETDIAPWRQAAYEVEVDRTSCGRVESDASVLVDWPADPLESRQRVTVRVRMWGDDGDESPWSEALTIEAGMLDVADWSASWITPAILDPLDRPAPSPFIRRTFTTAPRAVAHARLYVTSAGVHRIHLNGEVVGNHVLAPGWSSYTNRIRYDTHDVTSLITGGDNVIGAVVADGWWRGFLKWDMLRNVYGERIGLLAQLEITYDDGSTDVVVTDDEWRSTTGPILAADLYQGENYDARLELDGWDRSGFDDTAWEPVQRFAPDVGALVAPPGPPVRRIEELAVREVLTSPSGATVLDFGQNLVGRVRFTVDGDAGTVITLRHAEVLEHGEPAYRPLRNAEATDQLHAARRGSRDVGAHVHVPRFPLRRGPRLARRARSCRLRRRRVALRHGTHRDVLVRQRPAQPTPLERRVGHARQLPRRADRLPTARRTARLDRRPSGVRPDGGVPLRHQRAWSATGSRTSARNSAPTAPCRSTSPRWVRSS